MGTELGAISNSAATIIGSVIGVFGLLFVAVVGAAWRSINKNLDDKFDRIDQRASAADLVQIEHAQRLAWLEGRYGVPLGGLGRGEPPQHLQT